MVSKINNINISQTLFSYLKSRSTLSDKDVYSLVCKSSKTEETLMFIENRVSNVGKRNLYYRRNCRIIKPSTWEKPKNYEDFIRGSIVVRFEDNHYNVFSPISYQEDWFIVKVV